MKKITKILLILLLITAPIVYAKPDQATQDRINAWAKTAKEYEKQGNMGQARNAWQTVIRMVDKNYPCGDDKVKGEPTYTPSIPYDGQAQPNSGTVQVGKGGTRKKGTHGVANAPFSQGWLAGVKLHEATHCEQFSSGKWKDEPINRSWHEVLAYWPEIQSADELDLDKEERDEFLRRAKNDLLWLKLHIRDWTAKKWKEEKDAGNNALADEYVKLWKKMKKIIQLEQQGKEVDALKWKLEYKKEVEEQKKTATGASLDRLKEAEKNIKILIKAEELIEKYTLANHIWDAKDETESSGGTAIGLFNVYVENMVKEEMRDNLKEALKYKKQLMEKLKKARATAQGNAANSLDKAKEELANLIKKEEMQVPTPSPTPVPAPLPEPRGPTTPTPRDPRVPTPTPTPVPTKQPGMEETTTTTEEEPKEVKHTVRVTYGANTPAMNKVNEYIDHTKDNFATKDLENITQGNETSILYLYKFNDFVKVGAGYESLYAIETGEVLGEKKKIRLNASGIVAIVELNVIPDAGPLHNAAFITLGNYSGRFYDKEGSYVDDYTVSAFGMKIGALTEFIINEHLGILGTLAYRMLSQAMDEKFTGAFNEQIILDWSGLGINIGVNINFR
ncbi:hypothetical protein ACFL56_00105 [Candidatus Margulisiibacteriota bacterium]